MGVTEPEATFSACYGGAFLMWHPMKYASMLAEKMRQHGTKGWLVNTGWTGGSYGVGSRISLKYTRAIIDAIHSGVLDSVSYAEVPLFNLQVGVGERTGVVCTWDAVQDAGFMLKTGASSTPLALT